MVAVSVSASIVSWGTRQMRSELVVGYERPRIVMGMRAFCEINRMQQCNGEDE